jgi:hypothetical protein
MKQKTLLDGIELKSTYSLDILTCTICKNDAEISAVHYVLWKALSKYQWRYQQASVGTPSEEIQSIRTNFKKVIKLVENQGHLSVAHQLETILSEIEKDKLATKKAILRKVGRMMQKDLTSYPYNIKPARYNQKFSRWLKDAFKEYCENYKLNSPQANIDMNFRPPKFLTYKKT